MQCRSRAALDQGNNTQAIVDILATAISRIIRVFLHTSINDKRWQNKLYSYSTKITKQIYRKHYNENMQPENMSSR